MRIVAYYLIFISLIGFILPVIGCHSEKPSAQLSNGDVAKNQELARKLTSQAFERIEDSDFDGAEEVLKKAIAADPLYGPAHNDLGLVYFHREDLYNAAWEFENASKLMPRQAPPVNNLGLVLEKGAKLTDAEKSFATALELDAENTEYAGNYARIRIKLNQRDPLTKKLLELIIMKDHRPQWVSWAREQASRIPSESAGD